MLLLEGFSNFYKLKLLFLDQLEDWPERHLAFGTRQSPIPIDDHNVVPKKLPPLQFQNYDKMFFPILNHIGTNITITLENSNNQTDAIPYIEGGPLECEYLLKEIHFHWESEHTINGKRFPLEGHFVHYRKDAANWEEALNCEKGVCVLSALYEVSKCENSNFNVITEAVEEISDEIDKPIICGNEICFKSLLPKHKSSFYSYEGSFTSGDFQEIVIWIILGEPGRIERSQLKSLTSIINENCEPVKSNRRDLQKINDREITYTSTFLSRVRKNFRKFWSS